MRPNELQNPKYFFWVATAFVLTYFLYSLIPSFSLSLSNESQAATRPPVAVKNAEAAMKAASKPSASPVSPFTQKYQECLQIFSEPTAHSPAELLKKIQSESQLQDSEVGIENFHLITKDGLERRLHIRPEESQNGKGLRVQIQKNSAAGLQIRSGREILLMDVDPEGLPIIRETQPASESALKNLLVENQIQYHSRKESLTFASGLIAEVEWVNEKIHDLQIFSPSRSFSCRDLECQCD